MDIQDHMTDQAWIEHAGAHTLRSITGHLYVSMEYLATGDYGGAGSVGAANQLELADLCETLALPIVCLSDRHFRSYAPSGGADIGFYEDGYECRENWDDATTGHRHAPGVIELYGSYGYCAYYVRVDVPELCEALCALTDYPLISDDRLFEVEAEREWQAWIEFGRDDMRRQLVRRDDRWEARLDVAENQPAPEGGGNLLAWAMDRAYDETARRCNENPCDHKYDGAHTDLEMLLEHKFAEELSFALAEVID